jgi:hypothetical protein
MLRRAFKYGLWAAGIFLVATTIFAIWAYSHEEEIKQKALESLGQQLLTELKVEAIDYTIFSDFPNATLQGKHVLLYDTQTDRDTLLFAQELNISFSIWDLLQGEYTVKHVGLHDGTAKIRKFKAGDNYHFWKAADDSTSTEVAFDIQLVELREMNILYDDQPSELVVDLKDTEATLNGKFEGDQLSFSGEIEAERAYVLAEKTEWLSGKQLAIKTDADLDLADSDYNFNELSIAIDGTTAKGKAHFGQVKESVDCNLSVVFQGESIPDLISIFPEEYIKSLEGFEIDGSADVAFELRGLAGGGMSPSWTVDVGFDDAAMSRGDDLPALQDITGSVLVKGDRSGTMLETPLLNASLDGGEILVRGNIVDLSNPTADVHVEAGIELGAFQRFFALDSLVRLGGNTNLRLDFKGVLPNWEITTESLRNADVSGTIELSDATAAFSDLDHPLESINGSFALNSGYAAINDLSLSINGSDLRLTGIFHQFLAWLLIPGEKMLVEATCNSHNFELASVLSTSASSETYQLSFPDDIRLKLNVHADKFTFRSFEATSLDGIAEIDASGFLFKPVSLRTAEGEFQLELLGSMRSNGEIDLLAKSGIYGININALFKEFENFGQTFIQAENVRGKCTAQAVFKARMKSDLSIVSESIVSTIDLRLENGELIGLSSMESISEYMRSNKLIAPFVNADALEKKLKHIRFATLENRIEISDSQIRFPMMDIKSSAMDIAVTGTHWFDQRIDYAIGLYLRDILVQRRQDDFGEVEDDGLGNRFFLSMKGTTDNPVFGYDRQAKKEYRKQEMTVEKEAIKDLLKDELKLFGKKDSTQIGKPDKEVKVTLEWDETKPPKEKKPDLFEDDEDF